MWRTLWLVLVLPALGLAGTPTVIVDVQKAGPTGLQRLRSTEGVQWQAEFGTELLLGVSAQSLSGWLDRPDPSFDIVTP